jgi:hypothetical protein
MGVTKNYVSPAHTDRDVLRSMISWFIRSILYFQSLFLLLPFYEFCFGFKLCLCEFFAGDMADARKFVFPGFSLFFRPRSGTVLLLKSSWLKHYTTAVQNPQHCQYGCALYVRWSTQTTYVKRLDRMEQMGDMLDSAMHRANVARWWEIGVRVLDDLKNASPQTQGKRQLDGILHIKFSRADIK